MRQALAASVVVSLLLTGCQERPNTTSPTTVLQDLASQTAQDWVMSEALDIGALYDMDALSPSNVWVVGESNGFRPTSAVVGHWDGTAWQKVATFGAGEDRYLLTSIDALAENDIWAVGSIEVSNSGVGGGKVLVAHWDGNSWQAIQDSALDKHRSTLSAVAAVAPDNVWAVGRRDGKPLLLHWDGKVWKTSSDLAGFEEGGLSAVTTISDRDIWAVGWSGQASLIVHYDGATWKRVPSPSGDTRLWTFLGDIDAVSENDVWAVGYATDNLARGGLPVERPIIMHWDGSVWSMNELPRETYQRIIYDGSLQGTLSGVVMLSANDGWVVGTQNNQLPIALHWDGRSWGKIACPTERTYMGPGVNFRSTQLFGLAKVTADSAWAVGSYFEHQGLANRRMGYVLKLANYVCPTPTPEPTWPPPPTIDPNPVPPVQTAYPQPVPSGVLPRPVPSTQPR